MLSSAVSIAVYVGSNVAYTADSQATLTASWNKAHSAVTSSSASSGASVAPGTLAYFERPRMAFGQPMAKIVVPSIKWDGIVLEGTDDRVLSGGPGHVTGTSYPGEPDNMVISNHNSYSLSWGNVKAGDQIVIQANYGTYKYKVTGFKIIEARDGSVSASTHRPTLTFITCYPLW